jgi:hypothetical protein
MVFLSSLHQQSRRYCSHFTDGETEAQDATKLLESAHLEGDKARIGLGVLVPKWNRFDACASFSDLSSDFP